MRAAYADSPCNYFGAAGGCDFSRPPLPVSSNATIGGLGGNLRASGRFCVAVADIQKYRYCMTSSATSNQLTTGELTTAEREAAIEYFAAKLRNETDPSDVAAAISAGDRFVLVDTRGHSSWHQGRAHGAIHIPRVEIAQRAADEIPLDTPVVVYCWGPACNGATRSAIEFLKLGYCVREMIGGIEYWAREGLGVVDDHGPVQVTHDRLTSPIDEGSCDC